MDDRQASCLGFCPRFPSRTFLFGFPEILGLFFNDYFLPGKHLSISPDVPTKDVCVFDVDGYEFQIFSSLNLRAVTFSSNVQR